MSKKIISCPKCSHQLSIPEDKHIRFACPCGLKLEHANDELSLPKTTAVLLDTYEESYPSHSISVQVYSNCHVIVQHLNQTFYANLLDSLPAFDFDQERMALRKLLEMNFTGRIPGLSLFFSAEHFAEKMQSLGISIPQGNNNGWFKTAVIELTVENISMDIRMAIKMRSNRFANRYRDFAATAEQEQSMTYTHIGGVYNHQQAYCSDNSCPCPNTILPKGEGYVIVEKIELDWKPVYYRGIVACELGARQRGVDLKTAHQDAIRWWKTGDIPNRETPRNSSPQSSPVQQSYSVDTMHHINTLYTKHRLEVINKILDISQKGELFLFVDTETSGLPQQIGSRIEQPRIVQIAWSAFDGQGRLIEKDCHIIRPEQFEIYTGAIAIHGITQQRAIAEGKDCRQVLEKFEKLLNRAVMLIGHHIDFDSKVIHAELQRHRMPSELLTKPHFCTMKNAVKYCNIPGPRGLKYPKLEELHHKVFGLRYENVHSADADVEATQKCFWKLKAEGIFELGHVSTTC